MLLLRIYASLFFCPKNYSNSNTLTQLCAVLLSSHELRSFCNLNGNVPSISTFSRFRKIFASEIQKLFQNISIHVHNIFL
ncbi:transposase [Caldicellulosiruptor acetigenus]|uniref:transposase n=1 Tax=Caldicellulosiruptor acetigenus TaxID=301953 RepID=UPI003A5C1885